MDGNTLRELSIKVSQYFLDFLESDFKRQQAPRRRIVLQADSGSRSGMKTAPYPVLQQNLWQLLEKQSGGELSMKFRPRTYTRAISPILRKIIQEQIHAVSDEALHVVRAEIITHSQKTRGKAIANPEEWVDSVRKVLANEVSIQIVHPLLAMLDGPLSEQAYSVHDSIFSAETELIELVAASLDQALPTCLSRYLATGDANDLVAATESFLSVDDTRTALMSYFETFVAADAFLEFRDLETYAVTGENLQLYLYIGSLRYGNLNYPLFYVPIEVQRAEDGEGYVFTLVNHLYANKRAIDFVLQELGERQQREWLSPLTDRIIYLTPEQSIAEVARPLFRKIANTMDVGGQIDLETPKVLEASTTSVVLSTALHFAVFDRADEALLNDYEEMIAQARKNEPGVVGLFEGIVRGVLLENPKSIHEAVEAEWDAMPLVDRMVIDAPVPLNEEQVKILSAIRNPTAKIIVVEGPPGTGKSHTITAIAADCALHNRSCLILSDKTEALNVVQSKLSDAMSQVRHDKKFPNPILRLGQDQANFKRLTANQTLTQVSAYVKAGKANEPKIRGELMDTRNQLKGKINKTIATLGQLPLGQVAEVFRGETKLAELAAQIIPALQPITKASLLPLLDDALRSECDLESYLGRTFSTSKNWTTQTLLQKVRVDAAVLSLAKKVHAPVLSLFDRIDAEQLRQLGSWLLAYEQLRMPIFGYLFRRDQVRELERQLNAQLYPNRPLLLKREISNLRQVIDETNKLRLALPDEHLKEADLSDVYEALARGRLPVAGAAVMRPLLEVLSSEFDNEVPLGLLGADTSDRLIETWMVALEYLRNWIRTSQTFAEAPEFDYVGTKSQLERLNTTVMNAEVDNRLVSFMNNFKADAKTLAAIITQRQKFPEAKFANVREAFPIIIAGIREFGEYMPLVPNLFDVVVIDEASQVSVAQAFPALLRARKIVVLGDSKQFSNTKSSNASIALNDKYRADLEAFFRLRVSQEASMLQRLSKFDVKCSVLEFCQLCANYSTMLRKHFRSYQELISFSSETFYNSQLQAIKIRGVPLTDVIHFDQVDASEAKTTRGTNEAEAEFILEQLLELLQEEAPPTVGVITPFREQQTLLSKKLFSHAKGAEFQDILRLKVMTFDSCQGEERKIIFYSMVATAKDDALNYVFPVELNDAQESVEEKLKVQRLNVGFSRAEEMIWFVHSKPLAEFKGSIGRTLNHYANLLARGEVKADRTDPSSPMEPQVLDWLQKTEFYQANRNEIEILPQFPIGDYLRQLDPTYKHPAWRVDFLVTYTTDRGTSRIVVEYDGFEHHFQKGKEVNVGNHERYMLEADIERQLTLESYGYRFLRINRFNLGKDPITTISDRLKRLVDGLTVDRGVASVQNMQDQAVGLANHDLKACSRCKKIKPQDAFFDKSLKNGEGSHGRVCMTCKADAPAAEIQKRQSGRQGTRSRRWRHWR
jgi:very-short-patch-repair endonuclease